jgi:hypothetical protein
MNCDISEVGGAPPTPPRIHEKLDLNEVSSWTDRIVYNMFDLDGSIIAMKIQRSQFTRSIWTVKF